MLDSSPVALPPIPRPLKRSASTASLPTPPRTHHKRKGGRSRSSYDSDTDLESIESEVDEGENRNSHKKRRTNEANEADEEAFWMSTASTVAKDAKTGKGDAKSMSRTSSPPAPLLYRRMQNAPRVVAPVSPPPSHRRKAVVSTATTPTVLNSVPNSPPATPESRYPMRDSPNNPFLEDPNVSAKATPEPRTPQQEKPTVTYVFRGVRGVFPNPLYNHNKDRPLSPSANSRLPIDHPDFSPSTHCPPKLLFPEARRTGLRSSARQKVSTPTARAHANKNSKSKKRLCSESVSRSDNEDEETGGPPLLPTKLNFADGGSGKNVKSWQEELEAAGP
ncbi:hypothetical protein BDZ94DRAFT_1272600 [Collybia nuda]|uniref:Uncharacterized protein n=1 Tax=Collybia nuda TaxID=64659 RepID=A0A9P5XVQ6_9AGAR|nr:hypothetical protein BDZ94DRAFT_1272600 [Collybia nuda]